MLVPHLLEAIGVAATDLLAQGKAGHIATSGHKGFTSRDDLFQGKLSRAHNRSSIT
ncbi:hypothetical protein ACTR8H_003977 [Escherichia coli]